MRAQNPKKVYLVDNAFHTFLSPRFSPEQGRMLETIVMQELQRKNTEPYYFKESKECDFIIKQGNSLQAIQVTYELNQKNNERELKGLIEAMQKTKAKKGLIITFDQEQEIISEGKKIAVKPVWKWLLEP